MDEGSRYFGEILISSVQGADHNDTAFVITDSRPQYIGLQILEKLIMTRWKTLPDGQRLGRLSGAVIVVTNVAFRNPQLRRWCHRQSSIRRDHDAEGEDVHQ